MRCTRAVLALAFASATAHVGHTQIIGLSQFDTGQFAPGEITNAVTNYGVSVVGAGERLLVGVPGLDAPSVDVGGARVLEGELDGSWSTVATLTPVGLAASSFAGSPMDFDGERAVLGAPFSDTFGLNRGAVVVFDRASDGTWSQVALIAPPLPGSSDHFGISVALDGDRLVIGADGVGRAFVFERDVQGVWQAATELVPPFPDFNESFGAFVALHGDRAWVESGGTVFAFARIGFDWNFSGEVTSLTNLDCLHFDPSNETLLIGRSTYSPYGAVEAYEQTSPTTWALAQRLTVNAYEDGFGRSLAVRGDRLVVGAGTNTSNATIRRAFVFEREPGGPWTQAFELHGDAHTNSVSFGFAVALSDDHAHVGLPGNAATSPNGALVTFDLGALQHSGRHLSVVEGRDQRLFLRSGVEHAWHWFVVVGSASGVGAGTALPGSPLVLPLTLDAYSLAILDGSAANLTFWFGPLDANGNANVDFRVPPLAYVPFIGSVLHHAYFVIDPVTFAIDHVSNAVPLELVP